MRLVVWSAALLLVCAGCGSGGSVSNLITSTPDAAALQIAEANTQEAATAAAGYLAEHGSYDGMTTDAIRLLDPALDPSLTVTSSGTGYCVQTVVRGVTASLRGPGGTPAAGPC
jgi:hypothetical protein